MNAGRVMAIDYGTVRLGVALSDETRSLATPLTVVQNRGDVFARLGEIARKHDVREVVMGLPLTLAGEEGTMAGRVRAFARRLEEKLELQVTFVDERYSSLEAAETLLAGGKSRKARHRKGETDKRAAAIVLQDFLDARNVTEHVG